MKTKMTMKEMLAEGLYKLLQEKPFDKITIKQICDKTGVIRGTFYNHFYDKYEALEFLCEMLLIEEENSNDLLKDLFNNVKEHHLFFKKAFLIEGQNNFNEILEKIVEKTAVKLLCEKHNDLIIRHEKLVISYYANALVYLIRECAFNNKISVEELCILCEQLFFKNIYNFGKIR